MYQGEKINEAASVTQEPPVFPMIGERLSKQNKEYSSLVSEIEEKLHAIFDTRQKELSEINKKEVPLNNDFLAAISEQLSMMSDTNFRLKKVLDHLKRIVG